MARVARALCLGLASVVVQAVEGDAAAVGWLDDWWRWLDDRWRWPHDWRWSGFMLRWWWLVDWLRWFGLEPWLGLAAVEDCSEMRPLFAAITLLHWRTGLRLLVRLGGLVVLVIVAVASARGTVGDLLEGDASGLRVGLWSWGGLVLLALWQ